LLEPRRSEGRASVDAYLRRSLHVFDRATTIKILAPLDPTSKLEVLARKLL